MFRIGLISDTHGLLRPEALTFLAGSDFIVHAGDVCDPGVLGTLAAIAPRAAVRGNNDRGAWAASLRETELLGRCGLGADRRFTALTPPRRSKGAKSVGFEGNT